MKSILEELYYGNIDPCTSGFKIDSDYGRALKKAYESEEKLLKLLDEPAKLIFKDFTDTQIDIAALASAEKFTMGFKLGTLLTIEIFTNSPN
ncbi:MAG: hypothetical protein FWE24_10055 [Defluviitaleaceae bacterium]|nr:hypothetical protein [Defluviitaleaceae bacterium]